MKSPFSAILLASALAIAGHAAESPNEGRLIFIRPGDNGFLNIMPATIMIDGQRSFSVTGESTRVVKLPFGRYRFHVESPNPYDHSPAAKSWHTGIIEVRVGSADVTFLIEGASTSDGYDHWEVRKVSEQPPKPSVHTPAAGAEAGVIVWPNKQAMEAAERLRDLGSDNEVVQGIAISDSQIIKARFAITSKGNGTVSLPGLTIRVYDCHDDGIIFRGGLLLCEWRRESGQPYLDFVVSGIAEHRDEKDSTLIAEVPVRAVFRYVSREHRFLPLSCTAEIDFWSSAL